jgi:putrescine importer
VPERTSTAPALRRVLSRRDLILYGLVILTPTAPYPVYGLVQQTSFGHAALSYILAMVAMMFTAASYGKMSGAFPSAGSTYTYAQKALNAHVGFFAGWAMILDYFLIPLLSVVYAALTASRLLPQVPYWIWAVAFTALITLVNVRGIRVTTRAGNVMMMLMTVCAGLFVIVGVHFVIGRDGWGGLFVPQVLWDPRSFALQPLLAGTAIASLSYIGFDAISTLAEDTIHPERNISVATVLVCVIQTVFCVATVYVAALVWPDYKSYPEAETVILDISRKAGGQWMMGFVTFILLVAGLASALTGQAGASRLLLGMGRDGIISRRIFATLDPRYSTPMRSIYLMGIISLVGSLFTGFQLVVELLNFGAFVGFILVNVSVIRHFYRRLRQRQGWDVLANLIFPLAGALVCTKIWLNLSFKARLAGFCWLAVGAVYLAFVTRGFRIPPRALASLSEAEEHGR